MAIYSKWNPSVSQQPLTSDPTGMLLDEFSKRDRHLLLHSAGGVHMTTDAEQLRPVVALTPKRGKPVPTTTTDFLERGGEGGEGRGGEGRGDVMQ